MIQSQAPRFVVFFFIFSAFVIAGHILFGSKLRDFSPLGHTGKLSAYTVLVEGFALKSFCV